MGTTKIETGVSGSWEAAAGAHWRSTSHKGVSWCPLHVDTGRVDGDATVLIRMEPGAGYPEHEHLGLEEVLILSGGYRDHDGEHRAGCYLRYPAGSRHAPVALGDEHAPVSAHNPACLLFAVAHGGVRNLESARQPGAARR